MKQTRALINNRKVTYDTRSQLTIVAVSSIIGAEPALTVLLLLPGAVMVLLHPASSPQSCPDDRVRALDGEHLMHLGQQKHKCCFPSWNNQTSVYIQLTFTALFAKALAVFSPGLRTGRITLTWVCFAGTQTQTCLFYIQTSFVYLVTGSYLFH